MASSGEGDEVDLGFGKKLYFVLIFIVCFKISLISCTGPLLRLLSCPGCCDVFRRRLTVLCAIVFDMFCEIHATK